MSKAVYRDARIVIGGTDVSAYVTRWSIGAEVGDLYVAEIDLLDTRDIITIDQDSRGRARNGMRVPTSDQILVGGVDISGWIFRYERHTHVNKADTVRLFVQCDAEVLSINGTTPWVMPV